MRKEKLPAKRIRVLAAVMVFWGIGIAARLSFLQIVESAAYVEKAAKQQQNTVDIMPRRGDILGRDGTPLASSVRVYSVFAKPREMKNPQAVAKTLARLTGTPLAEMQRKLNPSRGWVYVKREVSDAELKAIQEAELPHVGFLPEYRRIYPNRGMAAHVLGYVDVDDEGRTGLEGRYNAVVRGDPGTALVFVDALGNTYQREQQMPQVGATLTTTIDMTMQHIVEKELRVAMEKTHAAGISIVVMDPNSGAILANANAPSFDPNDYRRSPQSVWSHNPSVGMTYEPGSTFKMVTIAAALEEGLTNPEEQIFCENGVLVLGRRRIRDSHPYGWLSVREIMQNSSNIGTIKLGIRVGEERLKQYIDRYGFGEKTNVDLPAEAGGVVRDLPDWTKTSLASISMGHEISVTPLQTAQMISAVANGGTLYKPYVVHKIDDPRTGVTEIKPSGSRVMSPETAAELRLMLEDVVTDGTARTSKLEGYRAAGKTGTAEKVDTVNGGYFRSKYVSSFAGFAPVSNPKLTIVVVVDDPKGQHYGGEVAAPVFKRIAEQILRNKSIAPDVPDYAPPRYNPINPERTTEKPIPPTGKKPDIKVMEASMTSTPADQDPLKPGEFFMPDFTGLSLRQAVLESAKLGLDQRVAGTGRVVGQSPVPGTHVRPGARIHLRLSLN